jgi:hypothetical protein
MRASEKGMPCLDRVHGGAKAGESKTVQIIGKSKTTVAFVRPSMQPHDDKKLASRSGAPRNDGEVEW